MLTNFEITTIEWNFKLIQWKEIRKKHLEKPFKNLKLHGHPLNLNGGFSDEVIFTTNVKDIDFISGTITTQNRIYIDPRLCRFK